MNLQKNIFIEEEADAWFDRNLLALTNYSLDKDPVAAALLKYVTSTENLKILEIGCSSGHRLQAIKNKIPHADVYGIEPSKSAIGYCNLHHKNVNIIQGTAEDLSAYSDISFDVIIIGFVFYVLDRNLLFLAIAEIDRVLKQGGHLIIIDFFAVKSHKNPYHHVKENTIFSYKQDYSQIFISSNLYHLIAKSSHHHSTLLEDGSNDFYNKLSVSTLLKDYAAAY